MTERIIKGRTLKGEPREYKFQLMDSKTAFQVMHEFMAEIQIVSPILAGSIKENKEPGDFVPEEISDAALSLIEYIPMSISWERLEKLNEAMLAGAQITDGSQVYHLDEKGFGPIDPYEAYTALFFAVVANYEPIVAPLLGALGKQGEDDTDLNIEKEAIKN